MAIDSDLGPEHERESPTEPQRSGPAGWRLVLGATVIAVLTTGWFVLSAWGMGDPVGDALEQALGVAFALLVVISVIGAVLGRDRDGGQGNR